MSTAVYDIGDNVKFTATFGTSTGGVNTTAVMKLLEPDGTILTPSVTHVATTKGSYYTTEVMTQAGRHVQRWTGTGALVAAGEDAFTVRPRQVTT